MTSLRPRAEHQEAVSRRMDSLTAELAAARPESGRGTAGAEADGAEADGAADEAWLAGHTRIRPLRAVPDAASDLIALPVGSADRGPGGLPGGTQGGTQGGAPGAAPVPLPGRHAARRRAAPTALVPEAVRGRVVLGPTQLVVVAVLVAVGLAVAGWWLVRGDPGRLEAPPTPVSGVTAPLADTDHGAADAPVRSGAGAPAPAQGAIAGPVGGAAGGATTVTVDVTGKVRRPGIAVLEVGARVVDALEAAGGARPGVRLSSLNLARVLIDGEQIVVGGPPAPSVGAVAAAGEGAPGGPLVNLNTATQTELESLPEVGPVTAASILSWRTEHGGFTAVDELLEVDGIGDATLAQIAPHVTI